MRIISFNINSLRARPHQLEALIKSHSPDVIALQETKVDDPDFPLDMISDLGYQVVFHGQKGHYGVATLSKETPLSFEKGFPNNSFIANAAPAELDALLPKPLPGFTFLKS